VNNVQKDGGLFPPATGLMPCYFSVGRRKQSAISKDNSKQGTPTPRCPLQRLYYVRQKKKSHTKAGGQRYPAIKGHARPV